MRLIWRRRLSSFCCVSGWKPVKAWFALQGSFLLLRGQVLMALQPGAEVRLLIAFKSWRMSLRQRGRAKHGAIANDSANSSPANTLRASFPRRDVIPSSLRTVMGGALRSGYVAVVFGRLAPGLFSWRARAVILVPIQGIQLLKQLGVPIIRLQVTHRG